MCLDVSEKRNSRGKDRLFLRQGNPAFDFFVGLYEGDGIKEVKYDGQYFPNTDLALFHP